jgi:hypothetical protein
MSSNYLPFDQAVILMHYKDTRMMEMHTAHGLQWFVLSLGARRKRKSSSHGGRIKPEDAKKILARPDVRGAEDGLFLELVRPIAWCGRSKETMQ